jgi:hypothetical protein
MRKRKPLLIDLDAEMPTRANQYETDRAWAAGFLDGEGYIGTVECTKGHVNRTGKQPKNRSFSSVVHAAQTKRDVLVELQRILGGTLGTSRCKTGVVYQWRAYGDNAIQALQAVLPYLKGKARQAELVIEFQLTKVRDLKTPGWKRLTPEAHARRLAIHTEIQALNARRPFLDAERLSEEAPLKPKVLGWKGDAIVRAAGKAEPAEASGNISPTSEQVS